MEARTSSLPQAHAALLRRIDKGSGSTAVSRSSRWRERAPLAAAITVTAMAGVSCVLGLSWLAVIAVTAEEAASAVLEPWAIGCALLAVVAFVAGLAALLRPRVRVALVGVASLFMILLVTVVIGFTMSGTGKDLDVGTTETLAGHAK